MEAGANATSTHVVLYSTLKEKQGASVEIRSMNLGARKNFAVWATSEEDAAKARVELGADVKIVVAPSYPILKDLLQGSHYIVTASIDDRALIEPLLSDGSNQAAIIDSPMKQLLTGRDVLIASYLTGAGREKVLAITGKGNPTPELASFLGFWGWTYRILRSPFEVLSEIYKMLCQTTTAA